MSVTPNLSLPKPTLDPSDVWGQDWHDAMDVIDATMDGAAGHSHDGTDGEGPKLTQAHSHESSDTDSAPTAIHHTLGGGANQAAAGNHGHTPVSVEEFGIVFNASGEVALHNDGSIATKRY